MKRLAAKALFFLWICAALLPSQAFAEYSLTLWDVPVTASAAAISIWGNVLYRGMDVPAGEDMVSQSDLLPWDKPVAGRYSEFADNLSDGFSVLALAPFVLGGVAWHKGDTDGRGFASFALMYVQALAIQNGLNYMARSLQLWPRPYIYAEEGAGAEAAAKAEREGKGEAYGSFFSGHASAAFTVAVFTSEWFSNVYPNSPYKGLVWASSLSLAGFVGALRIAAGKHYPSDVVVGALVGTGVSLAILKFHEKETGNVSFSACPGYLGLNILF